MIHFLLRVACLTCLLIAIQVESWPYGETKVRGVNLGSWLVLEKWITPKVFEGLPDDVNDEYKLCKHLGHAKALERLQKHWDTWVTENDFKGYKDAGLNHVRLPIGYWAVDIQAGEPWVSGSWNYVVKAATWCKKYGLQLMIDLHGAPGSQNGNDHSGQSGNIGFFYKDENLARASRVLGKIAAWANGSTYKDTVSIIQLLNEPILWQDFNYRLKRLKEYYRMAYDEVRKSNKGVVIAVHDAFISANNWYYLRDDSHYYWVMLDTHIYQVFSDEMKNWTCEQHYQHPCSYRKSLSEANNKLWTVVGEWSLATPKNCPNNALFASQQIGAFESSASGWFFWANKNGQGWTHWSFEDSLKKNWIRPTGKNTLQC